ncbi:MAG: hypothetical protein AAF492_00105 [Verrucomicrobiota bacterium]
MDFLSGFPRRARTLILTNKAVSILKKEIPVTRVIGKASLCAIGAFSMVLMMGCSLMFKNYHNTGIFGTSRVLDAHTGKPVKNAYIKLLRRGVPVGRVRTDSDGSADYRFKFKPVATKRWNEERTMNEPTQSLRFEISRSGYKTRTISYARRDPNAKDGKALIEGLPDEIELEPDRNN